MFWFSYLKSRGHFAIPYVAWSGSDPWSRSGVVAYSNVEVGLLSELRFNLILVITERSFVALVCP